jgi:hypothetical protein
MIKQMEKQADLDSLEADHMLECFIWCNAVNNKNVNK